MQYLDYRELCSSMKEVILSKIIDLDRSEFPWPGSAKSWVDADINEHCRYWIFVAVKEQELVSFLLFDHLSGHSSCHLLKILVSEDARGLGIAQGLLNYSIERFKLLGVESIYLEVSCENSKALSFYTKHDFIKLRTIRSFYGKGIHAFAMQLNL